MFTKKHALEIVSNLDLGEAIEGEEGELLMEHNPSLFEAYTEIVKMALTK